MTVINRTDRHDEESDGRSDEDLVDAVRTGESAAFAVLWERHSGAARRAARAITSAFDPDDVVSESFASVLSAIQRGGGPTEAFRPYLLATIRNITAMWGRRGRPVALDSLPDDVLADAAADPFEAMSERSTIAQVFLRLPPRHRTLLWYLEVEGMKPREIAPLMGLTPNAVSALSYRAREGFRQAWLEAHIAEPGRPAECRWFCERVVAQGKRALARADVARYAHHLRTCRGCQIVAADVENVTRRLRAVLLPLLLGGTASAAYAAGANGDSAAATESAWPDAGPARVSAAVRARIAVGTVLTMAAIVAAGAVLVVATDAVTVAPPTAQPRSGTVQPQHPVPSPPQPDPAPAARAPKAAPEPATGRAPTGSGAAAGAPSAEPVGGPATARPAKPRAVEEEPAARFRFTHVIAAEAAVPDVLTGVGSPGATVTLVDENGAVLVETMVAGDGTFAADVSGALLHQGMSIHASHTAPGSAVVERARVIGPLTFAVPDVSGIESAGCAEVSADDGGDASAAECGIRMRVSGAPGSSVAVSADGGEVRVVALDGGTYEGVLVATNAASHRVTVQYVDVASGRAGLLVERHVVLPSGGGSQPPPADDPALPADDPEAPVDDPADAPADDAGAPPAEPGGRTEPGAGDGGFVTP